jgi:hypothetical protein
VATLVTLRLLAALPAPPPPGALACACFGSPALGNAALAEHVAAQGWAAYFSSYVLSEDPVPRLFLAPRRAAAAPAPPPPPGGPAVSPGAQAAPAAGDASAAAGLEEALYREEAAEGEGAAGDVADSADEGGGGGGGGLASVPTRRPPRWAHSTLRVVARTAGAVRLPALPSYPAFSHFGRTLYLLPAGVAPASAPPPLDGALPAAGEAAAQRGWMVQHRMSSYRARALEICRRALRAQGAPRAAGRAPGSPPPPPVAAAELAPRAAVSAAEAQLPVMWAPAARAEAYDYGGDGPVPPGAAPGRAERRWALGLPAPAALVGGGRPLLDPGLPATYRIALAVRGTALDMCTGALLRLPGGVTLEAAAVTNHARAAALAALGAGRAEEQPGDDGHRWQPAARLVQAVRSKLPSGHGAPAGEGPPPALELQFEAPSAALLQLQGAPRVSGATLVLLTDFSKTEAEVTWRTTTSWLLGPEPELCRAAFEALQRAAAASMATSAAAAGRPRWLPLGAAVGRISIRDRASRTDAATAAAPPAAAAAPSAQGAVVVVGGGWRSRLPGSLLRRTALAPWMLRARRLVGRAARELQEGVGTACPPALLVRGVVVHEASAAVRDSGGGGGGAAAGSLALAEGLLRWKAQQASGGGAGADIEGPAAWSDQDLEDDDELLGGGRSPGLGARVLRTVRQVRPPAPPHAAVLCAHRIFKHDQQSRTRSLLEQRARTTHFFVSHATHAGRHGGAAAGGAAAAVAGRARAANARGRRSAGGRRRPGGARGPRPFDPGGSPPRGGRRRRPGRRHPARRGGARAAGRGGGAAAGIQRGPARAAGRGGVGAVAAGERRKRRWAGGGGAAGGDPGARVCFRRGVGAPRASGPHVERCCVCARPFLVVRRFYN